MRRPEKKWQWIRHPSCSLVFVKHSLQHATIRPIEQRITYSCGCIEQYRVNLKLPGGKRADPRCIS